MFKSQSYSRAMGCCEYLTSNENVIIYTTNIKNEIARLYSFTLRSKITEKQYQVRNFPWHWIRVWQFFKFENPTPVQTPAIIIHPTEMYPCFYFRNGHTDSCHSQNWKMTQDPGPVFPKLFPPGPGPNEKRGILPESTPVSVAPASAICLI